MEPLNNNWQTFILDTLNLQALFGHLYPWTGSSETWNLKMLSGGFRSVELIMDSLVDVPDLSPIRLQLPISRNLGET